MKKISNAPSWLDISADRTRIELNPGRAAVVFRIFEEVASGMGALVIAGRLNSEGVKTFGLSDKWIASSISKILRNRAVLGEYRARSLNNGIKMDVGDPVPDYYPRVISDELFQQVDVALKANLAKGRGRKGVQFTNLFSGLLFCGICGSKMRFQNQQSRVSFVCLASRKRRCTQDRWEYPEFEADVLRRLSDSQLPKYWPLLTDHLADYRTLEIAGDAYKARANFNKSLKAIISRIELRRRPLSGPSDETSFEVVDAQTFQFRLQTSSSETILLFRTA